MVRAIPLLWTAICLATSPASTEGQASEKLEEVLLQIDVKNADAVDVLRLLADVGQFNLVADPSVQCRVTLSLKSVTWREVLETLLRTCRLGEERMGRNLIRVAPLSELRREMEARRKYEERKKAATPLQTTYRRLAYARAKEIAPLLRRFLSPRGDVMFDERTNTLIIIDVPH